MHITYLQAIITGLVQGITELFPVSSLGHAVLLPAWIGGSWSQFTTNGESPYLPFTVMLHFASAIALFWVFRKRWIQLIAAGLGNRAKRASNAGRVFWLLVIATVPVGVVGLAFEHKLRTLFAKPLAAAIFITINGAILFTAERLSRRASKKHVEGEENAEIVEHITTKTAVVVGIGESFALLAGISRFGVTTSVGLLRKLSHHVASDFAFLAALPVILAASVYKIPEALSSQYSYMRGQMLAGAIVSAIATYFSVAFLVRWFKTRTLYPFAIYCFVVGIASIIKFH
jgi:undecaprenyl-diphosphatase